jgi:glycosyltransferase involved in cell wall biosynthesis
VAIAGRIVTGKLFGKNYRAAQLARLIDKLRPDLIHSLEIQHAGYMTLEAAQMVRKPFPKWWVSNWGSDIYLFGRLDSHKDRIRSVMSRCDYYSCECERDIELAKEFGFKGKVMPVIPNAGGIDLEKAKKLRSPGKTSQRKVIALKGYQNWSGRSLVGLRALELCADLLRHYELVVYSAQPENSGVDLATELLAAKTGIRAKVLPQNTPHDEILKLHGRSRISVGLSISDGISTSFLEALAMGSFPIQSDTSCANEWVECGKSGFLVPPEDPVEIAKQIRIALTDDKLVDQAAEINWKTVEERLDDKIVSEKARQMYREILADGR